MPPPFRIRKLAGEWWVLRPADRVAGWVRHSSYATQQEAVRYVYRAWPWRM